MAISSLFYGMEAYLDGDVEINNNVTTPEDDAVAAADQSAEVASDVADASVETKDSEVTAQMLIKMGDLYSHVKCYGIDRTFLSIYNSHGELDRVCGIQFPSCEAMMTVGDPYSRYSTAFIAAMEDANTGFWHKIVQWVKDAWNWVKRVANQLWFKLTSLFGKKIKDLADATEKFKKMFGTAKAVACYGALGKMCGNNLLSNVLTRIGDTLASVGREARSTLSHYSHLNEDITNKDDGLDLTESTHKKVIDHLASLNMLYKQLDANSTATLEVLDDIKKTENEQTGTFSGAEIISALKFCTVNLAEFVEDILKEDYKFSSDSVEEASNKIERLSKEHQGDATYTETGKAIMDVVAKCRGMLQKIQSIVLQLDKFNDVIFESLKETIKNN